MSDRDVEQGFIINLIFFVDPRDGSQDVFEGIECLSWLLRGIDHSCEFVDSPGNLVSLRLVDFWYDGLISPIDLISSKISQAILTSGAFVRLCIDAGLMGRVLRNCRVCGGF